ncbi:MAG: CDP-alcohol phosphatidyltransferase family protein [Candidatus Altiarchaeota archaeon]
MIKSKFETEYLSIRLGMIFSKLPLSANTWTLFSLVPALLGFLYLIDEKLIPALILFIISGMIDAIDGSVARVTKSVSNLGAFLDGIIDRYVELLLYVGLVIYLGDATIFSTPVTVWVILLVFGSVMPAFVRAYADHKGVVTEPEDQRRMGGLLERFERLVLVYAGMLAGYYNPQYLALSVVIVAVVANITALQRILFVISYER